MNFVNGDPAFVFLQNREGVFVALVKTWIASGFEVNPNKIMLLKVRSEFRVPSFALDVDRTESGQKFNLIGSQ